jgi:SAM-dependent methyltransferase
MDSNKTTLNFIRNGKHYDSLNNFDYDVPFYFELLSNYGGPILELGCGTGRLTIPIASKGYDVSGLDISESMLEEAKHKANNLKLNIEFVLADMRNFNLSKKFSLILLPFDTICNLYDYESLVACFNCVKRHLTAEGRFIIDVNNPNLNKLIMPKAEKRFKTKYKNPFSDGYVELSISNLYDSVSQINYCKWYFKNQNEEVVQDLNRRIYFPQELDNYLKYSDFIIEDKFGGFDKSPFTSTSKKQIIVCAMNGDLKITNK